MTKIYKIKIHHLFNWKNKFCRTWTYRECIQFEDLLGIHFCIDKTLDADYCYTRHSHHKVCRHMGRCKSQTHRLGWTGSPCESGTRLLVRLDNVSLILFLCGIPWPFWLMVNSVNYILLIVPVISVCMWVISLSYK